ncbi:endolytic transglycosylase MltG [Streptomyces triticagri]|uniref:Endolytic murein transglycosylase n=1 Tax=Streptomyces triticagri TaxID=2293568 RepID=A0A372LZ93_9ACTN|nr:endolytic transglycosylase MltG [Streptomyces triticagri]RFU83982.1 endolytic transglycosylase MltG [Streptomyces triticagri]
MLNDSPGRGKIRLTRRGRGALLLTGALVAGAAVAVPFLLLDDSSERPEALVVPEGWRTAQVYEAVDKALGKPEGTTKKAAAKAKLKLPKEAGGNPEGYLFPATYPLGEKSTPESLLSYMVATAGKKFGASPIAAGAEQNSVSVYQTVTIASIAQAEAETPKEMGKVARVVLNRLSQGMPLQMDSTVNYALNRTTLNTKAADTRVESPYNTYARMGLPPTPIANPGDEAMRAATSPPQGDWLYFVTVKKGDTRFTSDFEEHQRNVDEFNRNQKQQGKNASS